MMTNGKGGNFNYPGKGGTKVSGSKLGEKMFREEKFGDSKLNEPKGPDEKSPGVMHGKVSTDRGKFTWK